MKLSSIGSLVAACGLVFSIAANAQQPATPATPAAQEKPGTQKEHTMTGCLQKGSTAETWIVMNTAEKGPKVISITESSAPLAPHAGHQIAITGTDVPVAVVEKMTTKPAKGDHYMKITAVKMVSATCP